jgi:DNA-binding CsgD family transcriptional regulator
MFIDLAPSPRETGAAAGSDDEWEDYAVPGYASIQRLSLREQEVLYRVAQGHTNARIAEQLRMSVKTVETYRAWLSEKLGLYSRVELVRFAVGEFQKI